jgi:hypothetical protein
MGTSGLMSGEWKRSEWRDTQTPATERAGHSYGPPSRHRATPRLHKLRGALFSGKRPDGAMKEALRAGHHGATPKAFASRAKPGGLFRENPPGGGSFADGPRWLGRHSPLRGCSGLAALAAAKISRRRTPRSFQTES